MIEIHKLKDIETIKQLANDSGIEYNEKDLYIASVQDDSIAEFVCYKQIENRYIVIHISNNSNDFQIVFGLIKTLLFFADLGRIDAVTLPLCYERVAKAIGFTLTNSIYEMKLVDYQSKCGGCCK